MSLNLELQHKLELEFARLGIVAYSNCCRMGCTGTYEEDDDNFTVREKGIYFFRLHLNGMNYDPLVDHVRVNYNDFYYLTKHWDEECEIIVRWAKIVGVDVARIDKPLSDETNIGVFFSKPLQLEPSDFEDDSEDDSLGAN